MSNTRKYIVGDCDLSQLSIDAVIHGAGVKNVSIFNMLGVIELVLCDELSNSVDGNEINKLKEELEIIGEMITGWLSTNIPRITKAQKEIDEFNLYLMKMDL